MPTDILFSKFTSPPRENAVYFPMVKTINSVLTEAIKEKHLVGAVAIVVHKGEPVFMKPFGYADQETQSVMKLDTIFRLASVSKLYSALALGILLDSFQLNLCDKAEQYLPYFRPKLTDGTAPHITIAQLLSHTAGLYYRFNETIDGPYHKAKVSDGFDFEEGLCLKENLKRLSECPLLYEPGTNYQYSLATDVLGAIIEEVTNKTLPEAMEFLITKPLHLSDTGFWTKDPSRLSANYINTQTGPRPMQENETFEHKPNLFMHFCTQRTLKPSAYPSGGSGMAGTALDLITVMETIRLGGNPIIHQKTLDLMVLDHISPYKISPGLAHGYGWGVTVDPKSSGLPLSKGCIYWAGVYGSSWFIDFEKQLSLILMTNTTPEGIEGQTAFLFLKSVYQNLP
jgi:CubicO group peptidase (beta-lactamase class C family)